jgi:hypothetical protein
MALQQLSVLKKGITLFYSNATDNLVEGSMLKKDCMKNILTATLLLTLLVGCKKNNDVIKYNPVDSESAIYYRGQTQCSDEWGYAREDSRTKLMLQDYLKTKGITVTILDLTTAPNDLVVCAACSCPSGRVFVISAKKTDDAKLKVLGFYQ